MKIHRVRLQNLNSLRTSVELDFDRPPLSQTGLFAITGDTGAGKTTLLDAITLALFGKTARDHEREVMSNGADEASAEVEFSTDAGLFLAVWRQKRTKAKDKPLKTHRELAQRTGDDWITLQSGNKVDSTAKEKGAVEQTLGLNYDQFKRTVLLAQGEFAAFLKADEKDRAAVLERLTNTEEYSLLSRAAHVRAQEEQILLKQLLARRDAIQVLDEQQVSELREILQRHEADTARLRQQLLDLRNNLAWIDTLERLESRRQALETETEQLDNRRTTFAPRLGQLEQYRRALPLQPLLNRLREYEQTQAQGQAELEQLQLNEEQARQSAAELHAALEQGRADLEQAEKQAAVDAALFESVLRLDGSIASQQNLTDLLRRESGELELKYRDLLEQHTRAVRELEQLRNLLRESEEWLRTHGAEAQLAADLPVIEGAYAVRLRELFELLHQNRLIASGRSDELQAQQSRLLDLRQKRDEAAQALQTLLHTRQQYAQELDLPADEMAAAELERRLEATQAQLQRLEDFARHQQAYRGIARELSALRDEQDGVLAEDNALGKDLLTTLDLLDELRRKVHVKRERYEQELRKANYARDRHLLRPGEPCPLCGATHHPLTQHAADLDAFIDDAQAELQQAEHQLKAAENRHAALAARHAALRDRLGAVQSDLDAWSGAQASQTFQRLLEYEQKIGALLPGLGLDAAEINANDAFFQEKIQALKTGLQTIRARREQILQLSRDIQTAERRQAEHELQESRCLAETQLLERELEQLNARQQSWQQQWDDTLRSLREKLPADSAALPVDDATFGQSLNALLHTLRQRAADYNNRRQAAENAHNRLSALESESAQLKRQLEERHQESAQKRRDCAAAETHLQALRDDRVRLFGDRDPQTERAAQSERLERLRRTLTELQAHEQSQVKTLTQLQTQGQQQHKLLEKTRQSIETLQVDLEDKRRRAGFDTAEALLDALLPAEAAEALQQEATALERRAAELAQSRRDLEREQREAEKTPHPLRQRADAQQQLQAADAAFQEAQRQIGSLERQLRDNEQRQRDAGALLREIERQQQACERWDRLRSLIGSHDGAAFRKFAQSLTLQHLIQRANRHLAHLQGGRYRLHKKQGADLEIEIVDTFQADNIRSVSTLSGGETFLASLALALGLADMAGRRTRIQSLFIDEGFGALDENALELAITTLESLQAQGATIGIISHLRELKERISTQIQVQKRSDGFSEVQVWG